ncbi:efflux RND transporter periplasmic adaptor subunit [uncultured Thermanaerothrix sp.]|uniref:HlyD family secretion protein n=1 Tax=uncultured Thermanaerothrix sp. TaxID=1195149 RepID=UPI0026299BFA|nr:efflux RND transporter periplasmic adaptor subunit [uncultured Thermanaerothrix sp.]
MSAKRFWGLLSLSILLLSTLNGCNLTGQPASAPTPTTSPATTTPDWIIAEGRIVPRDSAWLIFRVSGRVDEVLVQEGQRVQAGEVLMRLGDREQAEAALAAAELARLQAQQHLDDLKRTADLAAAQARQAVAQAEQTLLDAQQALDNLDTDAYRDEIDRAWEEVTKAQDEVKDAQEEVDKYKNLDPDNPTRKRAEDRLKNAQDRLEKAQRDYDRLNNRLEQARAAVAQAEAALAEARHTYAQRQSGPDPDDLALAEAQLRQAEAQVAAAQASLDSLELKAPFAGTVVEVRVAAGESVMPNQPVILLADLDTLYVETTDLSETDVVNIRVGQDADIVADALPEVTLKGTVERISDQFATKGGDIVYTVRLRLSNPDPRLRWGMTVEVRFKP